MKESARKMKDGERRGLGNVPQEVGGMVLLPKRMNLSTKKNNLGVQVAQTPHMAARAPLQAARSAPRAQNPKAALDALAPPLHRQSISERKDIGKKLPVVNKGSRLPVPPPQARKGLSFRTPQLPPRPNQTQQAKHRDPQHEEPAEQSLPALRVTSTLPQRHSTEASQHSKPSIEDTVELSCQERFEPANLEMFKSPGEEEFQASRPSFLEARESLAWVGNLHRQSVHFKELQKQMNENDKRHVNDDDTDSFEAMEKRMKTPVKKVKSTHPQDKDEADRLLGASELCDAGVEVMEVSGDVGGEGEQFQEKVVENDVSQAPVEVIEYHAFEGNKENINTIHHIGGDENSSPNKEKVYKKKHELFGGGIEDVPSFSPLRLTQSLGCLSTFDQKEEEERIVPLCRAASNIQLGEGEEVILSDLVPAEQVNLKEHFFKQRCPYPCFQGGAGIQRVGQPDGRAEKGSGGARCAGCQDC